MNILGNRGNLISALNYFLVDTSFVEIELYSSVRGCGRWMAWAGCYHYVLKKKKLFFIVSIICAVHLFSEIKNIVAKGLKVFSYMFQTT